MAARVQPPGPTAPGRAARHLVGPARGSGPAADRRPGGIVIGEHVRVRSFEFEAIGVRNRVVVEDDHALEAAARIAAAEVDALDLACSRFRDDSELARLNNRPGRAVPVSALLFEAVEVALEAAASTGGVVDPTVGASLRGIGYDRSFELVVTPGAVPQFSFVPAGGWEEVELDEERRTITVPRGYELDLGATAKALGSDRIAAAAATATGSPVLVSLGGDIAVEGAPEGGWPVLIADDARASLDASGPVVALSAGGLATSSTTVRRWRSGDVELHHVVDPRTGQPATGPWRTASVVASTCVEANVAATAAIVLGDEAAAFLDARGLAARLVAHDASVTLVGGWPHS